MNQTQTLDPGFTAALRRELVAIPSAKPRHTRRVAAITAGVVGAIALGGVTAVAGLRPAGEVASPPLAPPVILNGVGSAKVVLPDAPGDAVYLRVELTCFDGIRCNTPGGGNEGPDNGIPRVQRDALPLTDAFDPHNAQNLAPLNPAAGLAIDVSPGTHWRLYAVYTDGLNPRSAPVGNGRTLGIPSNEAPPDLGPGRRHQRQVRLGGLPPPHRPGPPPAHARGDQPGPDPCLRRGWHHRDRQGRRQSSPTAAELTWREAPAQHLHRGLAEEPPGLTRKWTPPQPRPGPSWDTSAHRLEGSCCVDRPPSR